MWEEESCCILAAWRQEGGEEGNAEHLRASLYTRHKSLAVTQSDESFQSRRRATARSSKQNCWPIPIWAKWTGTLSLRSLNSIAGLTCDFTAV